MVILSQDRELILNFREVDILYIKYLYDDDFFNNNSNGPVEITAETHNSCTSIGCYSTLEKAKEVLKDILTVYKSCNSYCSGFVINNIYYMPED